MSYDIVWTWLFHFSAIQFTSPSNISAKTGCIQSWKTWKSHGIPLFFSRPGKVMEIESRFWKIHKKSCKLKGIPFAKRRCSFLSSSISIQRYVFVIRSNFGVFHIFLYCDWNLVSGSQRHNWRVLVVSTAARGSRYMSLPCHKVCKRSLILNFRSWRSHGKKY